MNPLLAMIANAEKLKDCRYHFQVIVELDLDHYNEIDNIIKIGKEGNVNILTTSVDFDNDCQCFFKMGSYEMILNHYYYLHVTTLLLLPHPSSNVQYQSNNNNNNISHSVTILSSCNP